MSPIEVLMRTLGVLDVVFVLDGAVALWACTVQGASRHMLKARAIQRLWGFKSVMCVG
jgi:hypothetical protein